jgi:large subunit ribosomal protein L3
MAIGLIGKKRGMTRLFTEAGESVPVTVIEVEPNRVTQIKELETDGYRAVQLTTGTRRASRVTKPLVGHYKKAGTEAGRGLWEFRLSDGEALPQVAALAGQATAGGEDTPEPKKTDIAAGDALTVTLFEAGQRVDISGTSIGKGYAGTIKRHNFRGQRNTHGNSKAHRVPGSIGQNQSPGRVFKGKKMSGQLGNRRTTTQNLEVVRVDVERNLLLVKGGVPGATGGDLRIVPAVKSR